MVHKLRFIRDPSSGVSTAVCLCGWSAQCSRQEFWAMATSAINHTAPRPVSGVQIPEKVKFVSGLPE